MTVFTFFARNRDGASLVFETKELVDRRQAEGIATAMMEEHSTALAVEVWRLDEHIATIRRRPVGIGDDASRSNAATA